MNVANPNPTPALINKLQIEQNAAARVLTRSRKYDHITPILQSLRLLPVPYQLQNIITYL